MPVDVWKKDILKWLKYTENYNRKPYRVTKTLSKELYKQTKNIISAKKNNHSL